MKWLKSTTNKSYTAQGHTIPGVSQAPLAVDEATYSKIVEMAVIKSLVKTGQIIVLEKYTEEPSKAADARDARIQLLASENERLADRVRELENAAPAEESPSKKELKAANKAKEDAEAKLAELQEQYDALKAEAEAKIAELTKEAE